MTKPSKSGEQDNNPNKIAVADRPGTRAVLGTEPMPVDIDAVLMDEQDTLNKFNLEGSRIAAEVIADTGSDPEYQVKVYVITNQDGGVSLGAEIQGHMVTVPLEAGSDVVLGRYVPDTAGSDLEQAFLKPRLNEAGDDYKRGEEGQIAYPTSRKHFEFSRDASGAVSVRVFRTDMVSNELVTGMPKQEYDHLNADTVPRNQLGLSGETKTVTAPVELGDAQSEEDLSEVAAEASGDVVEAEENVEETPEEGAEQLVTDPDEILKDHFDKLLTTSEIEGVDPEVAHEVRTQLIRLVNIWRELSMEEAVGEISSDIDQKLKEFVEYGGSFDQLKGDTEIARSVMANYKQAANNLANAFYNGDLEHANEIVARQYGPARDELDATFTNDFLEKIESQFTAASRLAAETGEMEIGARRERVRLDDTQMEDDERERLREAFVENGRTFRGIRNAIEEIRPKADLVSRRVASAEDIKRTAGAMLVYSADNISLQLKNLRNALGELSETFNRGVVDTRHRADIISGGVLRPANEIEQELTTLNAFIYSIDRAARVG